MKASLIFLVIFLSVPLWGQGKSPHPKKKAFHDFQSWPALAPGQVSLKNFVPFRAMYTRTYRQGAGPKAGESRTDRVIITAEQVGWDGREAVLMNMIDSAEAHYDDTNGRGFSSYIDRENLAVLFEMGPVPGKGKDYYLLRVLEDKLVGTFVTTDKGDSQNQVMETKNPGFGAPAPWMLASMKLETGQNIRFEPVYSVGLGPLNAKSPFRVLGVEKVQAQDGKDYQARVVESVANLTSPWVYRTYLIDRPPYLVRRESLNLDTGEKKIYMDLVHFQTFGQ